MATECTASQPMGQAYKVQIINGAFERSCRHVGRLPFPLMKDLILQKLQPVVYHLSTTRSRRYQ